MDPFACLKELLELIAEYHTLKNSQTFTLEDSAFDTYLGQLQDIRENIVEHLENLTHWLNRGGFVPTLDFLTSQDKE